MASHPRRRWSSNVFKFQKYLQNFLLNCNEYSKTQVAYFNKVPVSLHDNLHNWSQQDKLHLPHEQWFFSLQWWCKQKRVLHIHSSVTWHNGCPTSVKWLVLYIRSKILCWQPHLSDCRNTLIYMHITSSEPLTTMMSAKGSWHSLGLAPRTLWK